VLRLRINMHVADSGAEPSDAPVGSVVLFDGRWDTEGYRRLGLSVRRGMAHTETFDGPQQSRWSSVLQRPADVGGAVRLDARCWYELTLSTGRGCSCTGANDMQLELCRVLPCSDAAEEERVVEGTQRCALRATSGTWNVRLQTGSNTCLEVSDVGTWHASKVHSTVCCQPNRHWPGS